MNPSRIARFSAIDTNALMHVPIESARQARDQAHRLGADCAVVVGGGSTTGLGKAIALDSGLPLIAVPTTYSGSEMTPIYGLTEQGVKRTGRDWKVLPRVVIYDPALTLGLPAKIAGPSGINALAHCVEALWVGDRTPFLMALAGDATRRFATHLPRVLANSGDREARAECLVAAWLAGVVLASGTALQHKLAHVLGGLGLREFVIPQLV